MSEEIAVEAPVESEVPPAEVESAPADDRDPNGTWRIIENPKKIQTSEGEDVSITIVLGKGEILNKPRVVWIKGKWNEITKGDRYNMETSQSIGKIEAKMTFKAPKMSDSGLYTIRIFSRTEKVEDTFNLQVGPFDGNQKKIVIGKARKSVQIEQENMDVDFRARLKKVKKKESEGGGVSGEIWNILKSAAPRDHEKISFKYGISDLRGMLRRLADTKKNNKKGNMFAMRLNDTAAYQVGDKIVLECTLVNETHSVRWFQNGREITSNKRVQCSAKGAVRTCTIDSCAITDDSSIYCLCGDERTQCEVFVRAPPVTIVSGFEDLAVTDGEEAVFHATISAENGRYKILKDGIELQRTELVRMKKQGCEVTLTLPAANLDDAGFYQIQTNGDESFAELLVEKKIVEFKSGFTDCKVNFNESAEFKCEVSERDAVGKWFKDGKEVEASDRIEIRDIGCIRKIIINNVQPEDQGEYEYRVDGKKPVKMSACLEAVEVVIEKKKEAPKLFLSQSASKEITVKVGGVVSFDFGITGDPKPKVEWLFNGDPLSEDGKRMQIVEEGDKTSLKINSAKRSDTGLYCIRVTSEAGEDNHEMLIKVIDLPGPPGKPVISDLNDESCRVDWTPPLDDGDCASRGYIVERKKIKAQRWIRLNGEFTNYHNYLVRRLVDGNTYQVRITAVNECGTGLPSEPSDAFTPIAPTSEVTSFRLGRLTDTSIELNWRQPADVGAAGVGGYLIQQQILPGQMGKAKAEDAREDAWVDAKDKLLSAQTITINLDALDTGKNYYFRICTVNAAGKSKWVHVGPICCAESIEDPQIVLPRALKKRVTVPVGQKIHLNVPIQGKPKPAIIWNKINMVEREVKPPTPEPVAEPELVSQPEPVLEPVAVEPVAETVEQAPQPASEPIEPPTEPVSVAEEAANAAANLKPTEPASEQPLSEPAAPESATEPVLEPVAEPEQVPEVVTEQSSLPEVATAPEAAPEPEVLKAPTPPPPEPVYETIEEIAPVPSLATVRNADGSSILHIRESERSDSGIYLVTVKVGDNEVSARIDVAVVDVPSKVIKPTIKEIIGTAVCLEWKAPKDDGNTEIIGYTVEKRTKRHGADGDWYICHEKVRHKQCQVQDLIVGNEYQFRIRAFNEVGIGPEAITKNFANITKEALTFNRFLPEHKERFYAPEFTTILNKRNLVVGFNAMLHCAVKALPPAKITWFKNKMPLPDVGKYIQKDEIGVVQLELMRAKTSDTGTYTVVAENCHGKATLESYVIVREPSERLHE